jgi:hypothetical protein
MRVLISRSVIHTSDSLSTGGLSCFGCKEVMTLVFETADEASMGLYKGPAVLAYFIFLPVNSMLRITAA